MTSRLMNIGYVTIKDSKYLKMNSVNPLDFIFSKVNEYFEEINKNKCSKLVATNESKEIIKIYEELWSKMQVLIKSIIKNADDYDKKYMEIILNSDDKLPLNKAMEIQNTTIIVRAVFRKNNKHYPQGFLDECLYKS